MVSAGSKAAISGQQAGAHAHAGKTERMEFDRSRNIADMPPPRTPDEVAADFPVPLLTFEAQDTLEEMAAGTASHLQDGALVSAATSLSYTLWRHPDRADPRNLADLPPGLRAELDVPPLPGAPAWLHEIRERARYPILWEAVRTSWCGSPRLPAETELVDHVNYVVMNMFREERVRGGFPGELDGRVEERHLRLGVPIRVDGMEVAGLRLDTDPHVLGLAVDLGDRTLTVAVAREHLPYLRLAFRTRPPGSRGSPRVGAGG